jgi:DNA-binding beta-propeller fold protein YncE
MRRVLGTIAAASALALTIAQPAMGGGAVATRIRTTKTSSWATPSPDPAGLTYRKSVKRLVISDPEVDETTLWENKNIFEATTRGVLKRTGKVSPTSLEPEDVAWDNNAEVLYVADDDKDKIFRINPGPDGRIGSADDSISTALTTSTFGVNNPEGLAYRTKSRSLFISDPDANRVYHVQRGPDGDFGTGDDVRRSFDTVAIGFNNVEDIEWDPRSKHLFIVSSTQEGLIGETTANGSLVRTIDIAAANLVQPSGITLAPGSDVATQTHIYVTDRGQDNNTDPSENDGRLFEFRVGA